MSFPAGVLILTMSTTLSTTIYTNHFYRSQHTINSYEYYEYTNKNSLHKKFEFFTQNCAVGFKIMFLFDFHCSCCDQIRYSALDKVENHSLSFLLSLPSRGCQPLPRGFLEII